MLFIGACCSLFVIDCLLLLSCAYVRFGWLVGFLVVVSYCQLFVRCSLLVVRRWLLLFVVLDACFWFVDLSYLVVVAVVLVRCRLLGCCLWFAVGRCYLLLVLIVASIFCQC